MREKSRGKGELFFDRWKASEAGRDAFEAGGGAR
jgi:hypothetical protein